jgi:hypothetical protein
MPPSARVYVEDHLFVVADADADSSMDALDFSTGLAGVADSAAFICAGVNRGHVQVSTDALDSRPDLDAPQQWAQLEQWDDVAEFSLNVPHGHLTVERLTTGPTNPRPDLGQLSTAGPGPYRVRVHARGRDRYHDQNVDDSGETFHVVAWPEAATPPMLIKATSRCSYGLRLTTPHPQRPVSQPTPQQQAEDAHQAMLRQALLGPGT